MPANDEVFTTIENYDAMTVEQLQVLRLSLHLAGYLVAPMTRSRVGDCIC